MAVTAQDVARVAALARLDLSAEEEARLTVELGRILEYMERLNELDTTSVSPSAHPIPVTGTLRRTNRRSSPTSTTCWHKPRIGATATTASPG